MRAIRDNPLAAEATGIDVAQFKTRTFAVSAMITGIAGSLGAIAVGLRGAGQLHAAAFHHPVRGPGGGRRRPRIAGPVFGGLFITFLPNGAETISKAAPGAIYGVVLIAFMFLLPAGIAGAWRAGCASTNQQR